MQLSFPICIIEVVYLVQLSFPSCVLEDDSSYAVKLS